DECGVGCWSHPATLLCFFSRTRHLRLVACSDIFFLILRRPSTSTLFPYTTLFRSVRQGRVRGGYVARRRRARRRPCASARPLHEDRKSTRLNSSHLGISYAVFCLKKKSLFVISHSAGDEMD